MEHYFTPDDWPAVSARLKAKGITNFERYRFDLNQPEKGWQKLATYSSTVGTQNEVRRNTKRDAV